MKFPLYFSKKIAFAKDNKNNLSRIIIFIGRLSVALGVIVSLITVSTGVGSKNAIKDRMADFAGAIQIRSEQSNASYNSSVVSSSGFHLDQIQKDPRIQDVQKFVTVSGIIRTDSSFAGIIYKGIGKDFNAQRFSTFLTEGKVPKITEEGYNSQVVISEKISKDLHRKVGDSIVVIFSKADSKLLYRKFEISGVYKTDIKMIDDLFVLGDITHARKIQDFSEQEVGGYEVFLKDNDDIDLVYPAVNQAVGNFNFAEKVTDRYPQIVDWITIFDTNIGLIITIMLVVVVINIVMVLLILIIERTPSIGLLKTLGATNRQIRTIFINYTLLIMIPGLIVGNLVGLGFLVLQKYTGIIRLNPENYYVSQVPVDLNPLYIFGISIGILAISALALLLPSMLISKISPVRSIKYN